MANSKHSSNPSPNLTTTTPATVGLFAATQRVDAITRNAARQTRAMQARTRNLKARVLARENIENGSRASRMRSGTS